MTGFLGVLFAVVMELATSWVSTDLSGNQVRAGHTFQQQRAVRKVPDFEHAVIGHELTRGELELEQFRSLLYFGSVRASNYKVVGDNQFANIFNIVGTKIISGNFNIDQIASTTLWENAFSPHSDIVTDFINSFPEVRSVVEFEDFYSDVVVDRWSRSDVFAFNANAGPTSIPGIVSECKLCLMLLNQFNPGAGGRLIELGAFFDVFESLSGGSTIATNEGEAKQNTEKSKNVQIQGNSGIISGCVAGYCFAQRRPSPVPFIILGIVMPICFHAGINRSTKPILRTYYVLLGLICVILLIFLVDG